MKQTTNFNEYNIVGDDSSLTINNSSGSLVSFTNGNVGIGTISPTEKLDVSGKIKSESFVLKDDLDTEIRASIFSNSDGDGCLRLYNGLNTGFIATGYSTQPRIGSFYAGKLFIRGFGNSTGITNPNDIDLALFDFLNKRVTIGVSGTDADLFVNGNVRTDGVLQLFDITNTQKIELNPDGDSYINSGFLGIGTSNPAVDLHVANDVRIDSELFASKINSAYFSNSATLRLIYGGTGNLTVSSGQIERLRINSDGNVGIGTSNPLAKLHITDNVIIDASYSGERKGLQINANVINDNKSAGVGVIKINPVVGDWVNSYNFTTGGSSGNIFSNFSFGLRHTFGNTIGSSLAEVNTDLMVNSTATGTPYSAMRFMGQTGNIGIGTTNPIERLDVNGNIKADGILKLYDVTDTQKIELNPDGDSYINGNLGIGTDTPSFKLDVNGDISLNPNGFIRFGSALGMRKRSYDSFDFFGGTNPTEGGFNFSTFNGSSYIPNSLVIRNDGNVGIDISSPTEKLDVNGNIKADGILKLYDVTDTQTIELNPDGDSYINSGNIGIGTTSPTEKLEIAGNIKLTDNTGPYLNLYRSDIVISQGDHLGSIVFGGGPESYADSPLADSAIVIKALASNIAASGNSPSKLIIQGISNNSNTLSDWVTFMNGNVGIGTTNSGTKLYISGDPALNAIGTQSLLRLERPFNAGVSFAQGADIAIGRGNTYPSTQMRFILDNGTNNPTNPQTTIMTLDSSGNVGIGTTSPARRLHISKTDGDNELVTLRIDNNLGYSEFGTQSNYARILSNGDLLYAGNLSATFFYLGNETIQTFKFFNSKGHVGIRNSNPTEILDVNGNIKADGTLKLFDLTDTQTIELNPDGDSYINSGNLGIGTTTPSQKLDIIGAIRMSNTNSDLTIKTSYSLLRHYDNSKNDISVYTSASNSGGNSITIGGGSTLFNSATSISFNTATNNNTINGSTRMLINYIGNVGIGTISPTEKLTIAGDNNIMFTGVSLQNQPVTIGTNIYDNLTINAGLGSGKTITIGGTGRHLWLSANQFIYKNNKHIFENYLGTIQSIIDYTDDITKVGLGTSTPTETLDVNGNIKADGILKLYDVTDTQQIELNPNGDSYILNGNVGIGTTSPNYKFDITGNFNVNIPHRSPSYTNGVIRATAGGWSRPYAVDFKIGNYTLSAHDNDLHFGLRNQGVWFSDSQMYITGIPTLRFGNRPGPNNISRLDIGVNTVSEYAHGANYPINSDNYYYIKTSLVSPNGNLYDPPAILERRRFELSAKEIVFKTGNIESEAARFNVNGNLGIGTTTPTEKLDVNGNIKADGTLKLYDITDTQTISLNPDSNSYITVGNVGIGTTTPTEKLEVVGNIVSQGIYVDRTHEFGGVDEPFATFGLHYFHGNSNNLTLQKVGNSNLYEFATQLGYLRIRNLTENKNLTISVSDQSVKGGVGILNLGIIEHNASNNNYGNYIGITNGINATGTNGIVSVNADLRIVDYATSSPIENAKIGNDGSGYFNGNIGINTTLPTEKLDVNGNIKSSGYITGKRCGAAGYLASPVNITVTTANTYYPIGVFTVPVAADFVVGTTYPNGLKYTGTIAQTFHITWNATIESTSNNVSSIIDIEKNGVSIPMAKMGTYSKTGGEIYNLNGQCVVDLDVNDEIRFVVTANNNGEILTFDYFTASIKEFFD